MTDYTAFFLNNSGGVVQLECLEISHPSFTKVFRYTRNDEDGIQIGDNFYQYQPMSIKRTNVTNDLDSSFIGIGLDLMPLFEELILQEFLYV